MNSGRIYMHKHAMDVCFWVSKIQYRGLNKRIKLKGAWWNLGYTGEPWILFTDFLDIGNSNDWIDITERAGIKRTRPGVP